MNSRFEWDNDKARANEIKHGISFDEAVTVFNDSLARIFDDEMHSIKIGYSWSVSLSNPKR